MQCFLWPSWDRQYPGVNAPSQPVYVLTRKRADRSSQTTSKKDLGIRYGNYSQCFSTASPRLITSTNSKGREGPLPTATAIALPRAHPSAPSQCHAIGFGLNPCSLSNSCPTSVAVWPWGCAALCNAALAPAALWHHPLLVQS